MIYEIISDKKCLLGESPIWHENTNNFIWLDYLKSKLYELEEKHQIIGEVRGKGLFCGVELVKDRETREPVDETVAMSIVGHCLKNKVMIGRTNRCFEHNNNVLLFSPAFICTKNEVDLIIEAVDNALEVN